MNDTYFGPRKIDYVTDFEDGTVEMTFTNGEKEIVPRKTFAISITQEAKDYNYLQEVKMKPMLEEIMTIVLAYDLKYYEVNNLLAQIGTNIKERYSRAINYLWTGDDSKYTVGLDATDFLSVLEAEKVIKTIPVKDESESTKAE